MRRGSIGSRLDRGWPAVAIGAHLLLVLSAAGREPAGRFEHLSVEHGLSHGVVYSVLQDRVGFLWLATEDGLNRYDGSSVLTVRHDPSDPDSLASSNFGEVYQDRSGIFWLGTWGEGLDRYDPATGVYRHYRHDPRDPASLSQDRIEVLLEDSEGIMWVGTEETGLNRFDPLTETFVRYRHDPADPGSLPSDKVRAIAEDRSETLWIGTNGGLSRFDRETDGFVTYRHDPGDPGSLSHDRVRAIVHSRAGFLWIGTRGGGLARLEPATGEFRRVHPESDDPGAVDAIACLHEEASGVLWIGTYGSGLSRFDPETGALTTYRHDSSDPAALASDRVETLYEDRANVLWVGTRGGGADRLDLKPAKFTSYRHEPGGGGLPAEAVRAIAEDSAAQGGALWVGTDGGGLARLDRAAGSFRRLRHDPAAGGSLSDDHVWSLLVDRAGNLWVGTYTGGLNRRIAGRGSLFERYGHDPQDPSSLSHDRIQVIYQDRGGDVWLGTASGLNRAVEGPAGLEFESFLHDPADPASLSDDYVVSLLEDSGGTLWIGTRRGLHHQGEERGEFRLIDREAGGTLATDLIQVIAEDRSPGVLWIGTEDSGLFRLDLATGASRQFLVADGLPSNVIDGILQDDEGRLWLSTSRGLSRFDPERESFRSYDSSDGLESHSFIRNACRRTRDGELFFGGVTSLTSFFPEQVRDSPHRPPVVLTSLKVFDRELALGQPLASLANLELEHSQNFIALEFAALDYTTPEKNEYAYRLDGVDQGWIRSGTRSYASYAHLDPGRYVFRVKAANSDGVWNEEGRSLAIVVAPPWWRIWWFRAAALAFLGLSLLAAYRARTRNLRFRTRLLEGQITERERAAVEQARLIEELELKNAEMERFTYTVSHDLKSPLVTIKGFLGFLRQDAAAGKADRVERDVDRIGAAADHMHRLLDELLELTRIGRIVNQPTEQSVTELAREAAALVAGQIDERGVELEIAEEMPAVVGDRERLREVLQNLIDNGVKFMGDEPSPRIEIGSREEGGETVFYVRDNGQGVDPAYRSKVFELFERLDLDVDGTGIGLALVKRIIEVHGGRVWVESEGRGRGSTFWFTVPLAGRSWD